MPHMERCTPNSYVTPLNQRFWLGNKRRASQYQIDDHARSSLKAIFHCGRFARVGGATNFNHVKNQSRGHVKKVECSSTFMACPRAFKRTKNAQDREIQRKLCNVRSARAGKATAMENCLKVAWYSYHKNRAQESQTQNRLTIFTRRSRKLINKMKELPKWPDVSSCLRHITPLRVFYSVLCQLLTSLEFSILEKQCAISLYFVWWPMFKFCMLYCTAKNFHYTKNKKIL